jgi:opacity protein-like surface antigen
MRILAALLFLFAASAPLAAQAPASASAEPPVVAEARAFMASYAEALSAGDRAGIAGRYDRTGAYHLGNGHKSFETHARIVALYAGQDWQRPHRFEWRDLSYEPVGADAVVIAGQFAWTLREGAEPIVYSYSALLRRQDGVLRIRLEDESRAPPRPAS